MTRKTSCRDMCRIDQSGSAKVVIREDSSERAGDSRVSSRKISARRHGEFHA